MNQLINHERWPFVSVHHGAVNWLIRAMSLEQTCPETYIIGQEVGAQIARLQLADKKRFLAIQEPIEPAPNGAVAVICEESGWVLQRERSVIGLCTVSYLVTPFNVSYLGTNAGVSLEVGQKLYDELAGATVVPWSNPGPNPDVVQ